MRFARGTMLATAVAALLAPAGWAQDTTTRKPYTLPNSILLARSWDEAMKEAKIRNVPILFTTAMAV